MQRRLICTRFAGDCVSRCRCTRHQILTRSGDLTVTQARQGRRGLHVAWVLGISMALIVIGFTGLWFANAPHNANDAVGEYVDMNPYLTTDGGHTFRTITPSCDNAVGPPITNCDPNPRFISPLVTDVNNPNFWVTGGEDVWTDTAA